MTKFFLKLKNLKNKILSHFFIVKLLVKKYFIEHCPGFDPNLNNGPKGSENWKLPLVYGLFCIINKTWAFLARRG